MKKTLLLSMLIPLILLMTGCLKNDAMEDIEIVTTAYPIEYITNKLYGDSSTIINLFPKGIKSSDYQLTNKQLRDYSKKDLLIYNGFGDEANYAIKLLNMNKNLKIIDASYGIDYIYNENEIWLNPSNILMMSQNITTELKNYISNPYLIEKIEKNYEQIKVDITELDTQFKNTALNSKNQTIITYDTSFKFIEKYNFTVINLTHEGKLIADNFEQAKKLLQNKNNTYLFITDRDILDNAVKEYIATNSINTITLKTLSNITDEDVENNDDYLSIMNNNLNNISKETY